jgi:hypothetical protein
MQNLYQSAKQYLGISSALTLSNMVPVVMKLISLVEQLPLLTGPEKQQAVVGAIRLLVNDLPSTVSYRATLVEIADGPFLPGIVDGIVAASKNQLAINVEQKVVAAVEDVEEKISSSSLFSCCRPKAAATATATSNTSTTTAKAAAKTHNGWK